MKVTKESVIADNILTEFIGQAKESLVLLASNTVACQKLHEEYSKLSKVFDGTAKAQRELIELDIKSAKLVEQKIKNDQQAQKLEAETAKAEQHKIKLKEAAIRQEQRIQKENEKKLKQEKELSREYVIQSKRLNDLRNRYKDLILTQQKETAETRMLKKEIIALDATLKRVDATVGQHQRNVGHYEKAVGGLKNMLTQLGVTFGVFSVLKDAFNIIKTNEEAMASLSAITGLTGKNFEVFKDKVNEVAEDLHVSSTEVAKAFELIASAQPALLKDANALGKVTEQAIILNKAIKGDLAETSLALVGVMNQFGESAEEAARIINALAAGSQAGAATVNQINESMVKFGTTADLLNISIEESIGAIETLGEKQIFSAEAGTALRNILLKMSSIDVLPQKAMKQLEKYGVDTNRVKDVTLSFEERLRELSKVASDSTAIMQIFGTENATAATVLLNSVDTYHKMTEAVTGTNVANEQAAINSDTLANVLLEVRAQWENLVLKYKDGTGVLGGLKDVLKFVANNLETIVKVLLAGLKAWILYRLQVRLFTGEVNKATGVMRAGLIPSLITSIKSIGASANAFRMGTISVKAFGSALKSIPFVAIISGVMSLISIFSDAAEETEDLTDETDALADATKAINQQYAREKIELMSVFDALKKTKAGTEDRQKAVDAVNSKYGITLKNLSDEKAFVEQLDVAYQDLLATLKEKIRFDIAKEKMVPLITRQLEIEEELLGIEQQLAGAEMDVMDLGDGNMTATGHYTDLSMEKLSMRAERLKFELVNIERTLAGIETGPIGDDVLGGGVSGSSKQEERRKTQLEIDQEFFKRYQENNAANLVIIENNAIKSGKTQEEIAKIMADARLDILHMENQKALDLFGMFSTEYQTANLALNKALAEQKEVHYETQLERDRKYFAELQKANEEGLLGLENTLLKEGLSREEIDKRLQQQRIENLKFENEEALRLFGEYSDEYKEANLELNRALLAQEEQHLKDMQEKQKEIVEAMRDNIVEAAQLMEEFAQRAIDAIDRQMEKMDEMVEASKTREEQLRDEAEKHGLNADESIQAERDRQKQILADKAELERKKQELEVKLLLLRAFAAAVEQGQGNPIANLKGQVTDLMSFAESIPGFIDGTPTTVEKALGKPNLPGAGVDKYLVRVHGPERVINPELSGMIPDDVTNDELVRGYLHNRLADQVGSSYHDNFAGGVVHTVTYDSKDVVKAIKELPGKMPVSDMGFESIAGVLNWRYKFENRTTKFVLPIRKRF